MALDAVVEEGEHDAQHAGVGIQPANGDATDTPALELGDLPGREAVFGAFVEDEIVRLGLDHELGIAGAGRAALLFQEPAEKGTRRVDIPRKDPARETTRIPAELLDKSRRRLEGALHVDDQEGAMRGHTPMDTLGGG